MNSGTISDNTAKGGDNRRRCGGGGVLVYRGTFHAKPQQEGNAVSISNNIANSHGGGVCAVLEGWAGDKACVVLEDVDITANKSTNGNGGGIAFEYEAVEGKLIDCRITENSSACSGGGIWNNCDLFMKGCVISGNTASDVGGGMDSTHLFTIEDGKFTNNGRQKEGFGPTKAGGGLWAAYGPYRANTLTNVTVTGNYADKGGGICAGFNILLSMVNGCVEENEAKNGGGICVVGNGIWATSDIRPFKVEKSSICNNIAQNGGGVYIDGGKLETDAETPISGNTASENGGGMYIAEPGSTVGNNHASRDEEVDRQPGGRLVLRGRPGGHQRARV